MTKSEINAALDWYAGIMQRTNEAFMPLWLDEHRYLVLKGGGGSGKSIFAGDKIIERCCAEPGHRMLVCRKVARTLRESCFRQIVTQARQIHPGEVLAVNKGELSVTFRNGSRILFAGLDDVEKLKSIYNITGIWIEEASELLESDFNQLDIRLRGETQFYKQIIITFNPVSTQHWLKRRFFDVRDERASVSETTYKDNRFLDDEAKKTLEAFRGVDDYYYEVYALGHWGVTGRSVFNAREVSRRLEDRIKPEATGFFEYDYNGREICNIRWVDDPGGFILLYKRPEKGVPYVIGGDTAGEGGDSFVGQVLDNRSGVQVAVLRHRTDEDLYARQMYCLGMFYNTALLGIEVNFSTYPNMELERLRYPRLYVRETLDDYTHAAKRAFGFRTDSGTRPVIIAELIKACRDDINIVCDRTTLEEMLTFVRDDKFRPAAEPGAHDDCVMALAIAHFIRPRQSCLAESKRREARWTESMWEDYNNASEEEKKYLLEKWGTPTE